MNTEPNVNAGECSPASPCSAKSDWCAALSVMLADYRQKRPEDKRPDKEILTEMMDHFVKTGLIKKDKSGKYLVGRIV
jgi:hypothetical protein